MQPASDVVQFGKQCFVFAGGINSCRPSSPAFAQIHIVPELLDGLVGAVQ